MPDTNTAESFVCPDTIAKWTDWAMRNVDGLWENDNRHSVEMRLVTSYGGEDSVNPPFYKVNWIHLSGDTLFVSDQAAEKLVCMNLDGTVYWEYGAEGEGPGHFCTIGGIDTSGDWIAVCNIYGGNIEILDRNGELTSIITVSNPQDVIALSDSTLAILSKA
ncbi:hypothetical protein CSA37_00540 [Candidatus Fermentibacteria bacterium]|nr:MAG: hypothetical protein CSA37_09770 [Candidatus Fermentibacteria bacterium]PIE53687.1 MAG: hypothetical protein CSA37_00540 [Candidatus Fermentibacteria bacterium]